MILIKVIYYTLLHEITIQKFGEKWLLQVIGSNSEVVDWKEFGLYETANQYIKNKYLGGE